jgi:hypothetical protein
VSSQNFWGKKPNNHMLKAIGSFLVLKPLGFFEVFERTRTGSSPILKCSKKRELTVLDKFK